MAKVHFGDLRTNHGTTLKLSVSHMEPVVQLVARVEFGDLRANHGMALKLPLALLQLVVSLAGGKGAVCTPYKN